MYFIEKIPVEKVLNYYFGHKQSGCCRQIKFLPQESFLTRLYHSYQITLATWQISNSFSSTSFYHATLLFFISSVLSGTRKTKSNKTGCLCSGTGLEQILLPEKEYEHGSMGKRNQRIINYMPENLPCNFNSKLCMGCTRSRQKVKQSRELGHSRHCCLRPDKT